jgi:hypothetical protein
MAESFLEEQLRRIRQMNEQMSRVNNNAAELSNEMARDRDCTGRTRSMRCGITVPISDPTRRRSTIMRAIRRPTRPSTRRRR